MLLGDLQQLTMDRHYGKNIDAEAILRQGWAKVLTIRDIAQVAEGGVPDAAEGLYQTWNEDYDLLGSNTAAKDRVLDSLEGVRTATHDVLRSLD